MIKSWMRFFLGIVVSPVFILFVIPLLNCLIPIFKIDTNCVQDIAGFAFYGLPVVIIAILLSLPLIYLFIIKKWVKLVHFGIGGILISLIISMLMIFFGKGTNVLGVFSIMIPMGTFTSLLFWMIAIRGNMGGINT